MKKKQKDTKELFQAAKRRELIQKESGGGENRTASKGNIDQLFSWKENKRPLY